MRSAVLSWQTSPFGRIVTSVFDSISKRAQLFQIFESLLSPVSIVLCMEWQLTNKFFARLLLHRTYCGRCWWPSGECKQLMPMRWTCMVYLRCILLLRMDICCACVYCSMLALLVMLAVPRNDLSGLLRQVSISSCHIVVVWTYKAVDTVEWL